MFYSKKNYFALLILRISPSLGLSILCGIIGVLLLCHVVVLCFFAPWTLEVTEGLEFKKRRVIIPFLSPYT